MPHYDYLMEDGTVEEVFQSMSDDKLEFIGDKRVKERLICVSAAQINTKPNSSQYPIVSNSLPTSVAQDGDCKLVRERSKKTGKLKRPKPLIRSKKHENELCAKFGLVKD